MPDMVYAAVRANPRIGGARLDYNADQAHTMRGVEGIHEISNGIAVIANNTWRAFKAVDAIDVEWGAADYPSSSEEHWKAVSEAFHSEHLDSRFKDEGDVEDALAKGGVFRAEYKVPYLAHAPLEPMTAVVLLTGDRLDIWTGTQIPLFMQMAAAAISGLAMEDVHVHVLISGGSFGRRLEDDYVRQAVELATKVKGKPIKLTWSREEDMTHDFPRPLAIARGSGTAKDGEVECFDLSIASPAVNASQFGRQGQTLPGPDLTIVNGAWDQPFKIANYRVTGYRVPPLAPVSSWRSVGASGNGFLHESFLDELIHEAGADPLEERIRLCFHEPSRKVLETVAEMAEWGTDIGSNRGRGVAFTLSFGVPVAEIVEVSSTEDGIRIEKVYVAADVGKILDPINFEAQVKGGVIWGLGHAMNAELTLKDGKFEQTNFHAYEGMRLYQCPEIVVRGLENGNKIRGIGEPTVPPAAPALANAIFAATGQRIRELPLNKHIDFV